MNKPLNSVRVVGLMVLLIAIAWACQKEAGPESFQVKQQLAIQAAAQNSQMIASTQDVMSMTAGAFASQGLSFGRVAEDDDDADDDDCRPMVTNNIKIDRSHLDTVIISGTFIIDFSADTTCAHRKGKIVDSVYAVISHLSYQSFETVTFQNYWKDSTNIDGSISITSASGHPTVVKVNGSRVRYHDGTSFSWSGNLEFTIQRSTYTTPGYMNVTGSWSGTTRSGASFTATITKEIEFKAGCFGYRRKLTPVSGTIEITTGGVTSTTDFGDGTCDRTYTVTANGVTTEHHIG